MDEPELHLGSHVVVPDLAAWRRERLPTLPDTAWIEVRRTGCAKCCHRRPSATTEAKSALIYADAGVRHVWHIDPVLRMLEVFELRDGKWLLLGTLSDDAEVAAAPFAEAAFSLGLLWPFEPSPSQDK